MESSTHFSQLSAYCTGSTCYYNNNSGCIRIDGAGGCARLVGSIFDWINIPIKTETYTPPQPIYTPIDSINNEYGEAVSVTMYTTGGWSTTQIGTGFDLTNSTLFLQGKVFLQALGRNFVAEFKKGGCVNLWSHSLAGDAKSGPSPVGPQTEDAVRAAGSDAAYAYAASRALSVPLRSSVYRAILGGAERLSGVVAVGAVDVSLGKALWDELSALKIG
jgi:hypothetical protein